MTERVPRRTLLAAAVGLPLALACIPFVFGPTTDKSLTVDDMFIVLVYARHLVEDGSFYWNRAAGAVDGFTSLLDTLLVSLLYRIDPAGIIRLVLYKTYALHALATLSMILLVRRFRPAGRGLLVACLAGIGLGSSRALGDGALMVLETPLFVVLLLATLAFLRSEVRGRGREALFCALALLLILTRPEGYVLAPALVALRYGSAGGPALRRAWPAVAGLVLATLLYMAWHVAAFGHLFPNTYYAKTSSLRTHELMDGLRYLRNFGSRLDGSLLLLLVVALPAVAARRFWSDAHSRRIYLGLAGVSFVSLAMVVSAGGDSYQTSARFFAPMQVLVLAAVALAASQATRQVARGATIALALVAGIQILPMLPEVRGSTARLLNYPSVVTRQSACESKAVRWLSEAFPGARMGQGDFQRMKFYADEVTVVDLQGLNDARIAHEPRSTPVLFGKNDPAMGLRHDVDVWIKGFSFLGRAPLTNYSIRQIMADDRLRAAAFGYTAYEYSAADRNAIIARYRTGAVPMCSFQGPTLFINFLVRRDLEPENDLVFVGQ